MARREKNRAGFSHVRMCRLQRHYFPRQICAYILWSRGAKRQGGLGGSSRFELTIGIYLPRIGANVAQIGSDGATRL